MIAGVSPPSAQAGPTTGDQVGPYTLEDQLGEGGMARVFIARRAGAESVCVLKLLHVGLEKSTVAAKRFQREAHIASMLDHPHIAPVLDAGWAGPRFYIAMPFIDGETLAKHLRDSKSRQHDGSEPTVLDLAPRSDDDRESRSETAKRSIVSKLQESIQSGEFFNLARSYGQ